MRLVRGDSLDFFGWNVSPDHSQPIYKEASEQIRSISRARGGTYHFQLGVVTREKRREGYLSLWVWNAYFLLLRITKSQSRVNLFGYLLMLSTSLRRLVLKWYVRGSAHEACLEMVVFDLSGVCRAIFTQTQTQTKALKWLFTESVLNRMIKNISLIHVFFCYRCVFNNYRNQFQRYFGQSSRLH